MAYPCVIPEWALNANVSVRISTSGVDENGEEINDFEADLRCNLQLNSKQKLTAKKEMINITGKAYFVGDICPGINEIKGGTVTHNDVTYNIYAGQKSYNFDETINFTVLELM